MFLPIHAAGIYALGTPPGSCISDYAVSSYTPTVHSLNSKFSASSVVFDHTKMLIISQPNTPGQKPIHAAKKETDSLNSLIKETTSFDVLLLKDADATTDKVKEEMESSSWVHFACHGIQNKKASFEEWCPSSQWMVWSFLKS